MIRPIFHFLASQDVLRRRVVRLAPAQALARRFVAGETREDVLRAIALLNARGIVATTDLLGENVTRPEEARAAAEEYLGTLDDIARRGLRSNVSLKLTQFGLDLSRDLCLENVLRVLRRAQEHRNFVRIDMEGSATTQRTLDVFREARRSVPCVGVVIQSYLYRSARDVEELAAEGASIRLCKGAYREPPAIAFPRKRDTDRSYVRLASLYLSPEARARGARIGLATHDARIIRWAERHARAQALPPGSFEFQMLYGVRRDLQDELAKKGHTVRVYVPYGREWYPYLMRRLAERPENLLFVLKNLFRG